MKAVNGHQVEVEQVSRLYQVQDDARRPNARRAATAHAKTGIYLFNPFYPFHVAGLEDLKRLHLLPTRCSLPFNERIRRD